MKKALSLIFALALASCLSSALAAAPADSAAASIVIDADSGRVLCSKNADARKLIASTTKIMTALVVIDRCQPDEKVEVLPEHAAIEGSSMYLKPGGDYTVRDLLYGMLMASGNDAAAALAFHCGGDLPGFAALMNEKAAELGLENSSFENPHGLDGENHYSSAYDLAMITRAAMQNELFAQIVSTKTHAVGEQTYVNHNKLLWNYEGCVGVKTGYTMAAGRTLVSCAERDGLRLICVTLSDPDDWKDHAALYDWAFSAYEYRNLMPIGEVSRVPVISGEKDSVGVKSLESTGYFCEKGAQFQMSLQLPRFVYAGIKEGEHAGKAQITSNGELVGEYELVYSESVPLADGIRLTPWERFQRAWYLSNKYGFVLGGGA